MTDTDIETSNKTEQVDQEETVSEKNPSEEFGALTQLKKCKSKLKRLILGKPKPHVYILRLSGVIGHAGAFKNGITLDSMNAQIEKVFHDKEAKAVALQVNSPGGSPVQSELIYKRIRQLSEEKNIPVYAFIEDVGASGGYWLSCAGDEIYASRSSIVGSIGVIAASFGFVKAIEKMGIERRVHTQGENKSILDPFKPEKQVDIDIIHSVQKEIHDAFKDLVTTRREGKLDLEHKDRIFSGEFWSGEQAMELGLVDGIDDMYHFMKQKFGEKVKFIKVSRETSWLKRKLGMVSDAFSDALVGSVLSEFKRAEHESRLGIN